MEQIWDQVTLTQLVRRNIEEESQRLVGEGIVGGGPGGTADFGGASIAPLTTVQGRTTRISVTDILPFGLGQFKAPDATPPLWKTKPTLRESYIELVLLEEMERFTGEEWIRLNSNDPAISRGAMIDLVTRLKIMTQRNEQLTEYMRWQAFRGSLSCVYPDGGTITVDYGFSGTHLPTASTAWTDLVNADPVADVTAWSLVGADDVGAYYSIIHLNSNTWFLVERNQKIRSYLSGLGRTVMLPTTEDMRRLMRAGTGNFQIVDSGYLAEGATNRRLTKFIPDNRVLMTTSYVVNGVRIADVADGQVLVGGDTGSAPDIRQGYQTELIANPFSKNVFRRAASARMVRMYQPDAFLYATVGA